ncbi:MAG: DEAD/DEAH box helicase [Fimbriimonadaceae bacterium]|nr:DEAD/DEAH box helicase [Fimbriimonadaceae bacterium]QYK56596.1 MAG: DEAD/DEAH box helicase [Fimbriimonadaceae bacterium]
MDGAPVVRRLFGHRQVELREFPAVRGEFTDLPEQLHPELQKALSRFGVERLYSHQTQAFEVASQNRDVAVVTSTASGKSLCYNLPILQACLTEPAARALYLFPTKALAQDQAQKLEALAPPSIRVATYDGDTPYGSRSAIRRNAHLLLTNPDMLHVGILPQYGYWRKFLQALRYIVVDEMHAYRGVFGAHVGGVLRRLRRLCAWHNADPTIIACSATIANPAELFEALTGKTPTVVDRDGAPRGARTVLLVDAPAEDEPSSPNRDTANLLAEFAAHRVRTMVFCRARVTTELVLRRARSELERQHADPAQIDSYRGGYTPAERRQIEGALFSGRLTGLVSTNAMELGVDVGGLDAVLMNGYPGSLSSFWQQTGRAGRGGRAGLAVMLAHPEPLEQFLVREPGLVFDRPVENAVVNPGNPYVLEAQLRCAAHERALSPGDLAMFGPNAPAVAEAMQEAGDLVESAGALYYPFHDPPAPKVNIRGIDGDTVRLRTAGGELGQMERWRAKQQAHEGAVYLHRGETYRVVSLDLHARIAELVADKPEYFTTPNVQTVVEPRVELQTAPGVLLLGITVTTAVVGYLIRALDGEAVLNEHTLDLPPETYDSIGIRFDLASLVGEEHFGTIHAVEHALTAVAPLIAGCDRGDLGSAWYVVSPDTMAPAVYVFDSTPGGTGLCEKLYEVRDTWLEAANRLLSTCPCEEGCPACVLSPRCESGNQLLDKAGAIAWLRAQSPGAR